METWTITGEEKGAEMVLPSVPVPLYPLFFFGFYFRAC